MGDTVEIPAAFFGAVGSGHRRLSQAADAVLDQTEEVKGKPGTGRSSRLCFVDQCSIDLK